MERYEMEMTTDDEFENDINGSTETGETLPDEAIDEIAFLTRSPVRVRVLNALSGTEYMKRRELRERVDGVRTTVTRNLGALEDRGWIEHEAAGYRITSCGRTVVGELTGLVEKVSRAVDLRPALRWLDVEQMDIGVSEFKQADITTADSTNPYAPVEEQIELLRRSDGIRTALPTMNKQILRACRQTAESSGSEVELVIEASAVNRFRSEPRYADLFEEVRRECTVLRHDGSIPYYVGVTDERVQIGTMNGDSVTKVLIRFEEQPEVHSWAADRIARFKQEAQPVE